MSNFLIAMLGGFCGAWVYRLVQRWHWSRGEKGSVPMHDERKHMIIKEDEREL